MSKRIIIVPVVTVLLMLVFGSVSAESYRIDTTGAHASINFKIKHLGYSWLTGRFNSFAGTFNFDENKPENSKVSITAKTASIDSAHALRDIHLRGDKYLNVKKYPEANFVSTSYKPINKTSGILQGNFQLHGVTRPVTMTINEVGAGKDPWGGFRRGYETSFKIRLHDYNIMHDLGAASEELELTIYLEGVQDTSSSEILNQK